MIRGLIRLAEKVQETDRGYRRFGAIACWVVAGGFLFLEVHAVAELLRVLGVGGGVSDLWLHLGYSTIIVGVASLALVLVAPTPLETQINWLRPIFEHPEINVRFTGTAKA